MTGDVEQQITEALASEAGRYEMSEHAWDNLALRLGRPHRRPHRRIVLAAAVISACLIAAAIAITSTSGNSEQRLAAGPARSGVAPCAPGDPILATTSSGSDDSGAGPQVITVSRDGQTNPITEEPEAAADPSFAPGAERLAIVKAKPGFDEPTTTEIWVVTLDGSKARQLTSGHLDGDPSWSPTGDRIAFRRWDSDAKADRLMSIAADGARLEPLVAMPNRSLKAPAWSRDSTQIAFVAAEANRSQDRSRDQVWVSEADGSNAHAVAEVPGAQSIDWYPAGDALLVSTFNLEDGEVLRIGIDDGTRRTLAQHATLATLSDDGVSVYFMNKPDIGKPLWQVVEGRVEEASLVADGVVTQGVSYVYDFYGLDAATCGEGPN